MKVTKQINLTNKTVKIVIELPQDKKYRGYDLVPDWKIALMLEKLSSKLLSKYR